jgi:short-subunit dehydrogenase
MTQSLRALLAAADVSVHAVLLGPIDTEMSRSLAIPKASPQSTAAGIFNGLEDGEEEIFPDPASAAIADGWRNGAVKAMERESAAFVPQIAASAA